MSIARIVARRRFVAFGGVKTRAPIAQCLSSQGPLRTCLRSRCSLGSGLSLALFCLACAPAERLGDPIGDVVAAEGHVVDADMLHAAFAVGEDLQLALGARGELVVGALGVFETDLSVALA